MPTRLPILIVDATSILLYVYKNPLLAASEKGIEQPDVYNFCKLLIKVAKKFNLAHIAIVWDGRKNAGNFVNYELDKNLIMEYVNSMRMEQIIEVDIPTLDIVFSMIRSFNHQHHDVIVITADENLYPLATDAVKIFNPWEKNIKTAGKGSSVKPSRHPNPTTTARTTFHEKNWQLGIPFLQKFNYKKLISALAIISIKDYSLLGLISKNYNHSFHLVVISSKEQMDLLCNEIKRSKSLCINLQGSHIDPMISSCLAISIAVDEKTVHYIALKNNKNSISLADVISNLKPLLADKNITKTMHDATFTTILLKQIGMPVDGVIFDVMIAATLLEHNPKEKSNDVLMAFYKKNALLSYQDMIVKNKSLETDNFIDQLSWQSVADTHQIITLKKMFEVELKKEDMLKLFETIDMPVNNVLSSMEYEGIYCDTAILKKIDGLVSAKLEKVTQEIHTYSKEPVNLNSAPQVRKLLFDTLKLPVQKKLHTSEKLHKRRNVSTDAETLVELSKIHPIAKLILQYRQLFKFKRAYVESLPKYINKKTHKIHPMWAQNLTATDRISCTSPNLQNIPTDDLGIGVFIRSAFQAQANNSFLTGDYNEIELHILAHVSQDKNLKTALAAQKDIHRITAASLYSVTEDKVTSEQRSVAKKINLSISYGLTSYGLASDQHISVKEAAFAIQKFFELYPSVKLWIESTIKTAQKKSLCHNIVWKKTIHTKSSG